MKTKREHKHLFPIVNAMVQNAIAECEDTGDHITCAAGCDHCCHLFIEVSWEEAEELVDWIQTQPAVVQQEIIERVQSNASAARRAIAEVPEANHLLSAFEGDMETPDDLFDNYFYKFIIPCMFLSDQKTCMAYETRPTACRLHLVSSDPYLCSREVQEDDDYSIPEAIETLKEEAAPAITALERDGRWGHFGIVLESALKERGLL